MTEASSFAPRSMLEHPDDFGVETDVEWLLARSLDGAVQLARAIDQHTQALSVGRMLRRGRHSMTDLAVVLGERPETLASKLRGRRPAPEADLVIWAWMTETPRTHAPLAELVAVSAGGKPIVALPALQRPARHGRPAPR